MPFLESPEVRLWVETSGAGSPATVIAHGLSSSSSDIAGIAAGVGGTKIQFDFRGHGKSPAQPGAGFDQAAMARDFGFVADRYGATHAIGVSLGAATILRILCDDPDRFAAACLIMPAWIDGPSPDREANMSLAGLLEHGGVESVAGHIVSSAPVRALIARAPAWESVFRGQAARMATDGLIHALREYPAGSPPVRDVALLGRVRAPILVLGHEGDPGHPAAVTRRLGSLLPNAEVRIAKEPLAMLDDMEACGRDISGFFARATAAVP